MPGQEHRTRRPLLETYHAREGLIRLLRTQPLAPYPLSHSRLEQSVWGLQALDHRPILPGLRPPTTILHQLAGILGPWDPQVPRFHLCSLPQPPEPSQAWSIDLLPLPFNLSFFLVSLYWVSAWSMLFWGLSLGLHLPALIASPENVEPSPTSPTLP